ncbi:CARDB domain-containing protein [Algoriphagus sp.]|uniref:CARDB domain-containing protein n=1 Tax=Algoriphagus sp. TaxID=1872435 RepID=UPI00391D8280
MRNFYTTTNRFLFPVLAGIFLQFLVGGQQAKAQELSGTYTIGATGDYANFNAAVSALSTNGVSGSVVFNVQTGTYTEQVVLNAINGASSTNTITFQSQSGNPADVELRFNSGSGAIYTVNLAGASHLRFKNLKLTSINATNSRILAGTGTINDLIVENVVFTAPNTTSTLNTRALVYMDLASSSSNLQFLGNSFTGGSTGIILIGSNDIENPAEGILISENTFRSNQYGAMDLSRLSAPRIEENDVLISSSAGNSSSLILANSRGAVQILKNKFIGSTLYGMRLTDVVNTSGTKSLVANNFVAGTSSGTIHLVRLDLISQLNFYHNTLNNYGFGHGIYFVGLSESGVSIVNNLIKTGAGLVLDIASAPGLASLENLDHNGYFNTGSNLVRTGSGFPTTEYPTLNSWQSASGSFEQNSLFGNPFFVSDTDLRPTSTLFESSGTSLSEVPTDIDGESRSATPSIGADEYIGIPKAPLAGTYTVDFNSSGERNFKSVVEAAAALNFNGISASVIFQIANRTYSGQIELGNIEGSSIANTITFESASGNNTDVIILASPSTLKNFVWSLTNTSHIRIRNLTISVNGGNATIGRNFVGVGSINHFQADNVRFLGGNMSGSNANRNNVYLILQDSENINFNNCEFRGGYQGLNISRALIENIISGVTVSGNSVRNTNQTGISMSGISDLNIVENDVLLTTVVTGSRSISLSNITGNIQVTSNKFIGGTGAPGAAGGAGNFQNLTGSSQNKGLIANNFFSSSAAISVELANLTHINFYHNSILNTGTGLGIQSSGGLAGVEGVRVINNLIKTGSGAAIRVFSSEPIEAWDYNGYYTIGSVLGILVNTEIGSLAEWQTATGFDTNTLSFDPIFTSDTDLTSTAPAYANSGLPVPEVTVDFNGAERKDTPSRGAVEFDGPPISPLIGEYTINPVGSGERNFISFGAAVFALQTNGVEGAVIFKVANGTYNEQIVIPDILGASSTNSIRFESQSGNSNDVILQWAVVNIENYVVRFDNAKHIYFKDMTLATASAIGSANARVLEAYNTISNLTFENCQIRGNENTLTGISRAVVYFNPISADDIRFINNKIQGGSYGIYFRLNDVFTPLTNLRIEDNEILSWRLEGINVSPIYGGIIKRNTIHTLSTSASRRAVLLNSINNGLEFEGNKIFGARTEFTNGISNSVETPVLITNNFFTNNTTSAALLISNTAHFQIFHNNVLGTLTTGPAFEYSEGFASVGNKIKNNIFKSNTGYAIRINNTSGLEEINHNGYFTSGANLARWLSTDAANLDAWYTLTGGLDFSSLNVDPLFTSDEALYTTEEAYQGAGIFLPSVTVDIDGLVRNQPPSIGANEVGEVDPCLNVSCSPGYSCEEGVCVINKVQVSGIVVDFDTQVPLFEVKLSRDGAEDVFTDASGEFSFEVEAFSLLTISFEGYNPIQVVVQAEAGPQILNLELVSQCSGIECPLGQSCFQGGCFPESYSVSGTVRNADTNELLSGVLVRTLSSEEDIFTDENGSYSISALYNEVVSFSKAGFENFTSDPILGNTTDLDVLLQPINDLCEGVACPPGFACNQGGCFPESYSVSGTVRNADTNELLSGVLVRTLSSEEDIFTDESGSYSIPALYNEVISFSKAGYENFSSDPILGNTTDLDVLLQPIDDLCDGVTCPLGSSCNQGGCFPESYSVSGTVRNADTNELLSGVLVRTLSSVEDIFTDESGSYSILALYNEVISFSKAGYENFSSDPITDPSTELGVFLQPAIDLCEGVICLPGFSCTLGTCFEDPILVTGTIRDVVTYYPLPEVSVFTQSSFESLIKSNGNGVYSIYILPGEVIYFSLEGYENFSSQPVLEATNGLDVVLTKNCDGIFCPIGQSCFNGQCYLNCSLDIDCPPGTKCFEGRCVPLVDIFVSGIVRDIITNEPLSNVFVTGNIRGLNTVETNTNNDGYYEISLKDGAYITFSKTGYDEFTLGPIELGQIDFNVNLQLNPCKDTFCPIGQSCLNGECYLNCTLDIDCLPGTKCFEGRCLPLEDIFVSGIVRDIDTNVPIANIRVLGTTLELDQFETFTDANGYYEIILKEGSSIIFNNSDYEEFILGPIVLGQSDFDVYLRFNPCEGILCPIGKTCVGGECKQACSMDIDCPPGTVCAGGACLTFDELCLITKCPQGTVCLNGRCITEVDLCFNKICPEGTYCLDGDCIVVNDPFLTISGTVRDKITGNVIPNIEIEIGDNYKTISGRSDGTYTAKVPFGFSLNFSRFDYVEFKSPPMSVSRSSYNVELYKNWCLIHSCQPGQVCVNGRCETIFYTISGIVRDELTNEPIANATVKTAGASTTTDETGAYTIEVILDNAIQFVKVGYATMQSPIIKADNASYDVLLGADLCDGTTCAPGFACKNGDCVADPCAGIVCQPGEICFNGFCLAQPDLTILGTVKDIVTGEPIAASAVVNSSPTLVDYNGYFIVQVPYGEQILFIANGYEWEYSPFLVEDFQVLEIFMTPDGVCENVSCPDGKICANGVCIDPCENTNCPPGTNCYSGQCLPVVCESSLTTLQITPEIGTSETEFNFTISYRDLGNFSPKNGYPRLVLEPQNADPNDPNSSLNVEMSELDPSDGNLADGKLYTANVSGLSDNTAWKAYVEVENEIGCTVATEPINAPNVSVNNLDIAIFANNISFSNDTPLENETITIFARVRNLSDFPAEDFVVSAYDGENLIFSTTVNLLEARSNVDLSWVYSFDEAGFYPIKVVIDETNVLEEINELNNFAIRPVLVGNYVLPGGIEVSANPNTNTVYVNSSVTISGTAQYFGIDEGVNPNVVGANVTLNYETGSTQTTTNSNGGFSRNIKMPGTPGIYTFTGTVTDYTLTAQIPSFQVEVIPYPEKPDLKTEVVLNQTEAFAGGEVSGTATISNVGELTAINFIFRVQSCEGIIEDFPITSLAPGESLSFNFTTLISDQTGSCFSKNNCSISAIADPTNQVDDKTRNNNSAGKSLTIYPEAPDLTPSRSSISSTSRMDAPFQFTVRVDNIGGVAVTENFSVNVYLNDELVDTRQFDFLDQCGQLSYPVTLEFENPEDYQISIKVDEPIGDGVIIEADEANNVFTRTVRYLPPPAEIANLYITNTLLSVTPASPESGQDFLINAKIRNNGNAAVVEDIEVNFRIEENGVFRNDIVLISGGLEIGAETTVQFETSLFQNGNHSVLVEIDPNNLIEESTKFDNKAGMPLCVDLVAVQTGSVWSGNFFVDTQQNLSGRVRNTGLFTAYNVRVDFLLDGAEIGNVIIPEIKPSFGSLGQVVSIPYVFRDAGIFQLEMAIDRNDIYIECNEANNSVVREIRVRDQQPDLRILPEYISPTELNPEPNEEIGLFVSFENIGVAGAQPFKVRVTIDDVPIGNDIQVNGLAAGQLSTVPVEVPYSSPTAGVKVIRGIIDVDQESDDVSYANNEATRALVVGQAPNLFFTKIDFSTYCPEVGESIEIYVDIENEGDLGADAEVHFYYVTESDTIPIDFVNVSVDLQSAISTSINWTVVNPEYGILAEIKNSNPQEFDDLDNLIFGEFIDIVPPTIVKQDISIYLDENGVAEVSPEMVDNGSFDQCGIAEMTLSQTEFDCTQVGPQTLIFTVKDNSGNESSADVIVTVLDDLKPTITAPEPVTVSTDAGVCEASEVILGTPVTDDNCSVASVNNDAPAVFPIGETMVTWIVEDASGNTETATQLVTVNDVEKPTITAPAPVTVSTDAGVCEATGVVLGTPITGDNCSVADVSNDAPAVFPIGETLVTWTVTDASDNTETATQLVTVNDVEKPTITAPEAVTVSTDAGVCEVNEVALGTPVTDDNCSVANVSNDAPNVFPVGETLVTWTVEDASGNTETATQLVIVNDTEKPTITAPAPVTVSTDAGVCEASNVILGTPVTDDNCSVADVSNDAPAVFPIGETLVTWTVEDASGNTETATQLVTVNDVEKPTITAPEPVTVSTDPGVCEASEVILRTPVTDDNCSVASVTNDAPAVFPIGETLVTWIVEDASGNTETATQLVTVNDLEKPTITAPEDLIIYLNPGETEAAEVSLGEVIASDNCSEIQIKNNAPIIFPIGETIVTWTATDAKGNSAEDIQKVTVIAGDLPTITAPDDLTVSTDEGVCEATIPDLGTPTFTGPVSLANISNNAPDIFPIGTTEVIWTVIDEFGNSAEDMQLVTVNDIEKPTITAPEAVTVSTDAGVCEASDVILGTPVTDDNCSVASVTNDAPAVFPIGETLVTWTVTDASGNTETATQLVTVEDNEAPLVFTQNLTFEILEGETVSIAPEDVDAGSYDNCNSINLSIDQNVFTDANEGENNVRLIGTDNAGNISSAQATVTIVVIREPVCKVYAFAEDLSVSLDKKGSVSISTKQVDKGSYTECTKGKLNLTLSKSTFTCADIGKNSVTLTATDRDGNVGTVEFKVTVVDDTAPRIAKTPKSIKTTILKDGESFSLPDYRNIYSSTDNCSVATYEQLPVPGTMIDQVGSYTITFIATDTYGNSSQSQFELIVEVAGTKGGGKGGGNGGGKGKNKSINTSDLIQVAWNTPFKELKDYTVLYKLGEETVEIMVDWNEEDYDPLVPGIYEISGKVKQLSSNRMIPIDNFSMYLLVQDKPMPIDITLSNEVIAKNQAKGQVIGTLETKDQADSIHIYQLEASDDFELDGNQVIWIGAGELRHEYSISVSSIDRVGQRISREIRITREIGANQVTIYPNPASKETNIKVDLNQANDVSIKVFDSAGKLVFEESGYQERGFIRNVNLQTLSAGLYQVQVQIGFEIITKRLVKVE